jgi:hypothetical protein
MAKKSRRVTSGRRGKTGGAPVATGSQRRDLFTAAERKLLAETAGTALDSADRAAVLDRLKRVRGLRDKWRDLLGHQARKGKRSPQAVAEVNARSREKADLLHAAVARLEQRFAALEGAPTKPAAGSRPVKKSSRVAAHRATRAGMRAALAEKTADLNRGRLPNSATKPAPKPAAKPAVASASAAAQPAAATADAAKASRARRQPRPPIAATVGGAAQAVRFDRSKQRSARAGAKQARLALKGVSTRRGGHVLASGKRAQARRDKRSR